MDLELRNSTYGLFVDLGRAPTVEEAAEAAGSTVAEVEAGWRRLHEAHALVLSPEFGIVMVEGSLPRLGASVLLMGIAVIAGVGRQVARLQAGWPTRRSMSMTTPASP